MGVLSMPPFALTTFEVLLMFLLVLVNIHSTRKNQVTRHSPIIGCR